MKRNTLLLLIAIACLLVAVAAIAMTNTNAPPKNDATVNTGTNNETAKYTVNTDATVATTAPSWTDVANKTMLSGAEVTDTSQDVENLVNTDATGTKYAANSNQASLGF